MIAILMPTFNGKKYLQQQIDSLFNQSHTNFNMIVRDDGSRKLQKLQGQRFTFLVVMILDPL